MSSFLDFHQLILFWSWKNLGAKKEENILGKICIHQICVFISIRIDKLENSTHGTMFMKVGNEIRIYLY
jgi:hypothetical protein